MTTHPFPLDNPFISEQGARTLATLTNAGIETFAVLPLLVDAKAEVINAWCLRVTNAGREDMRHALVWTISSWLNIMTKASDMPMPLVEPTSGCDCPLDHVAQAECINTFVLASREGDRKAALAAYVKHVHRNDASEWDLGGVDYATMLLLHISVYVNDYRSGATEELPPL